MLESAQQDEKWGRYTFLGYDPILELTCHNHKLTISTGMNITKEVVHPGDTIREILSQYKSPLLHG